jgi:putative endonuclease
MNTRKLGNVGEDIACVFLEKKGFVVVIRNFQRKWGELDIIATRDNMYHFFEVKSVTFNKGSLGYRPEDNVHGLKMRSIRRMIETYFMDQKLSRETEFYFHVLCVFMNVNTRRAQVKWIENIIL